MFLPGEMPRGGNPEAPLPPPKVGLDLFRRPPPPRPGPRPQSAFWMHATLSTHFLNGAYYPVGGPSMIPWALIPQVTAAQGGPAGPPLGQELVLGLNRTDSLEIEQMCLFWKEGRGVGRGMPDVRVSHGATWSLGEST